MFVEPHADFIVKWTKRSRAFLLLTTDFVLKRRKRSRHDYRCSGITASNEVTVRNAGLLLRPRQLPSCAHCSTGRNKKMIKDNGEKLGNVIFILSY